MFELLHYWELKTFNLHVWSLHRNDSNVGSDGIDFTGQSNSKARGSGSSHGSQDTITKHPTTEAAPRLPRWLSGKGIWLQRRRHKRCGFHPWIRALDAAVPRGAREPLSSAEEQGLICGRPASLNTPSDTEECFSLKGVQAVHRGAPYTV